jgi:hypothetical protein
MSVTHKWSGAGGQRECKMRKLHTFVLPVSGHGSKYRCPFAGRRVVLNRSVLFCSVRHSKQKLDFGCVPGGACATVTDLDVQRRTGCDEALPV